MAALADDDVTRATYPSPAQIEAATERAVEHIQRDQIDMADPLARLDVAPDVRVLKEAVQLDANTRRARLNALRHELAANNTHQVQHEISTPEISPPAKAWAG